jgi:hypothetical protein
MRERRRIHRQPSAWIGSFKLAGESASGWRECRIVDVSALGLGISFDYPEPNGLVGRFISLNLSGDGGAVNVRLEGEIKNAALAGSGVRAGIELVRVSETQQAITALLNAMNEELVAN